MVLDCGPRDFCAALQREFHAESPGQVMLPRILGHGCVIDVTGIEVFPPNSITPLAHMPGNNAFAIFVQRIEWHDSAFPDPMEIVAPPDDFGLGVTEIIMKLASMIGHLRQVMMNA